MPNTHHVHMLLETNSPLTHMMGTNGNEALISREAVLYKNTVRHVPFISGNAIRHRLIREPGARRIIGAANMCGKMNIDQLNYLFYGGSLVESSVSTNIRKIADLQAIFPLYRLLGGCLKNQVVGGSLNVHRGMLICRENVERLNKILPESHKVEDAIFPSEVFVDQYQYTRGDASKLTSADFYMSMTDNGVANEKSNLMIFNGQTIVSGALFYIGFVLRNVDDLEVGALFDAISRWDGFLGGQGSRGHGRCTVACISAEGLNIPDLTNRYNAHVEAQKDQMRTWLEEAFPGTKQRKRKGQNAEELAFEN